MGNGRVYIKEKTMTEQITEAVKILKAGGAVVYPTDTAYGLAVDATNMEAVKNLYRLKGRNFKKPVSVIFPTVTWLKKIAVLNVASLKLMNSFLPGALTLVLPMKIKGESWNILSAGKSEIGVRYPDSQIALELVHAFGKPITTTSANISGEPTGYSVLGIKKQFFASKNKPNFYIDSGKLKSGKLSTVVLCHGSEAKILRQGAISENQISKIVNS